MTLIKQIRAPLLAAAKERALVYSTIAQRHAAAGEWEAARRYVDWSLELWRMAHAD